ncbi:MAG: tRNA1(Val) (adenine(37)-N6)-methyltransferase [Bacteroidota bacterium]
MSTFQFKEFSVNQDRCAMKIGTDGVLLGAWVDLNFQAQQILDIGAGTGIIALQMAQRSNAELIDAIELDPDAYEQCVENFEQSLWGDRLFCYHASWQEFVDEMDETYDLIISNPPFFDHKNDNRLESARNTARFTDQLPFDELLNGVAKFLHKQGKFATIIPVDIFDKFCRIANHNQLHLNRLCYVKGNADSPTKRCLAEFGFEKKDHTPEHLIIEKARHEYTDEYIAITKDFYLNM